MKRDRKEKALINPKTGEKNQNSNSVEALVVSKYRFKEKLPEKLEKEYDIFFSENQKLTMIERLKVVLYYNYFNMKIRSYTEFNSVYYLASDIYQIRNRHHRSVDLFDFQKDIYEKIDENPYKYYLIFYGFLADFVQKITVSLNPKKDTDIA